MTRELERVEEAAIAHRITGHAGDLMELQEAQEAALEAGHTAAEIMEAELSA